MKFAPSRTCARIQARPCFRHCSWNRYYTNSHIIQGQAAASPRQLPEAYRLGHGQQSHCVPPEGGTCPAMPRPCLSRHSATYPEHSSAGVCCNYPCPSPLARMAECMPLRRRACVSRTLSSPLIAPANQQSCCNVVLYLAGYKAAEKSMAIAFPRAWSCRATTSPCSTSALTHNPTSTDQPESTPFLPQFNP